MVQFLRAGDTTEARWCSVENGWFPLNADDKDASPAFKGLAVIQVAVMASGNVIRDCRYVTALNCGNICTSLKWIIARLLVLCLRLPLYAAVAENGRTSTSVQCAAAVDGRSLVVTQQEQHHNIYQVLVRIIHFVPKYNASSYFFSIEMLTLFRERVVYDRTTKKRTDTYDIIQHVRSVYQVQQ